MARHIITNRHGHKIEVEDALHEIFKRKEKLVIRAKEFFNPIEELKELISELEKKKLFYDFKQKITNNIKNNKFSIIAEIKQRSPSAGDIIPGNKFDPVKIAKIYNDNKATCLSVLTEKEFFCRRRYLYELYKRRSKITYSL